MKLDRMVYKPTKLYMIASERQIISDTVPSWHHVDSMHKRIPVGSWCIIHARVERGAIGQFGIKS